MLVINIPHPVCRKQEPWVDISAGKFCWESTIAMARGHKLTLTDGFLCKSTN